MIIPLENQLNTVLTSVFGTEIYPIVHPDITGDTDSVTNMFGIWSIIGGQSFNKLEGNTDLSKVRVQISIYSNDYTELKTTQKAVNTAMQAANTLASSYVGTITDSFEVAGALNNVRISVPVEGREEDTRRFFSHDDYYIWQRG
jgi:hypothetical protein